jgi:eukaryotic-like serine/threonine-protein kinase
MAEDPCLGTETLLAYVEARADDRERAQIVAHASHCATCREVLSALGRADARTLRAKGPTEEPRPYDVGGRLGRYVVTGVLGMGGMGAVYSAHDPELDRDVAIKLLLPGDTTLELQERLRREAQAMAQLAHPNVVTVHDVGVVGDRIFVAMELVDGTTLATWLDQPRTVDQIIEAFLAAGRGLAAAHAAGLAHRDFKPENVFVGGDGRVRVGDFGLARDLTTASGAARTPNTRIDLTVTGTVMGTPLYMAPEQHRGDPADARSDQFSFCVALYAALNHRHPYEAKTYEALMVAVETGAVVPPRVGSRRVRAAIMRGLSTEPEARWPTLDALLAELAPRPRRWPWIAAIGGIAIITAITVFALTRPAHQRRGVEGCDFDAIGNGWTPYREALTTNAGSVAVAAGDAYVASWYAIHRSACRVRYGIAALDGFVGPLAAPGYAVNDYPLVLACLNLRKTELFELRDQLRHLAPPDPRRALAGVAALRSVDDCRDVTALRRVVRAVHPSAQATVTLRALAGVRALRAIGDLDAAAKAFDQIAITNLDDATRAEVLDVGGLVAESRGELALAMTRFAEAAQRAATVHDDPIRAEALVEATRVSRLAGSEDPLLRTQAEAAILALGARAALERRLRGEP